MVDVPDSVLTQEFLEEALFLDLLRLGHAARLQAHGRSMLPFVRPGTTVLIEPPPFVAPPLAVGDIVLVHSGGCLRLHRLVGWRQGDDGTPRLLLKGDGLLKADPLVHPKHLYGRAAALEGPRGRTWLLGGGRRALHRAVAFASRIGWRLASACGMGQE